MRKVTWGEIKKKIDEQVRDEDIVNHIILMSGGLQEYALDDIEVWGNPTDYGKAIQNKKRSHEKAYGH